MRRHPETTRPHWGEGEGTTKALRTRRKESEPSLSVCKWHDMNVCDVSGETPEKAGETPTLPDTHALDVISEQTIPHRGFEISTMRALYVGSSGYTLL